MTDPVRRLVVDTDLGVDDAVALLLALADPGVEILAITTVTGNVDVQHVNRNVRQVLEYLQRSIPVRPCR